MASGKTRRLDFMVLNHDEDLMPPLALAKVLGAHDGQAAWKDATAKAALVVTALEVKDSSLAAPKVDIPPLVAARAAQADVALKAAPVK
jgi:hypothetical protein